MTERVQSLLSRLREPTPAAPVRFNPHLIAYVSALTAGAAALAALTVQRPRDMVGLVIAAAAILGMANVSVRVGGMQGRFTATQFLQLGLAFTFGPVGCLAGAVAESSAAWMRYSNAFRYTFNLSACFLADIAGWFVFTRIGSAGHGGVALVAAGGVAAGIVLYVTNFLMLAAVLKLASRRSMWEEFRASLSVLPYNLFYGYAAVGFAALHDRFGPLGFTFGLAPVAALQVFLMVLQRHTEVHEAQRNHLLERLIEQGERVERSYDATLVALTHALDARDKETEGHSRRVVEYTSLIAAQLGIVGEDLKMLCHGALLHDIGKIGVPDAILHKPSKLTEEEWQVMRRHPEIGALMVEEVTYLAEARQIILHHHERYDGRGYPLGLKGTQIHVGARAFAVADTVDAITQDRPYRRGRSFDEARQELMLHRGTQFDPDAVDAFLAIEQGRLLAIAAIRARVGVDLLAGRAEYTARGRPADRRLPLLRRTA